MVEIIKTGIIKTWEPKEGEVIAGDNLEVIKMGTIKTWGPKEEEFTDYSELDPASHQ